MPTSTSLLTGPVRLISHDQPAVDAPQQAVTIPSPPYTASADQDQPDAPQSPHLTGQHHLRAAANENKSNLADVSTDLSWLGPLIIDDGALDHFVSPSTLSAPAAEPALAPAPAPVSAPEPETEPEPEPEPKPETEHEPDGVNNSPKSSAKTPHQPTNNHSSSRLQPAVDVTLSSNNNNTTTNNNNVNFPIHQRKPSPGLAARLKALGLGTQRKTSQPSGFKDREIGRLPEEQLRQLDEYHKERARQLEIERRGRPWKGVVRIPSKASLKSSKSNKDAITPEDDLPGDASIPLIKILDSPAEDHHSELLTEFEAAEPPTMDTNKFRLPDHTNGNGTKVTLDTRKEHIDRDARPLPSPEESPPPVPEKDTPPISSQPFNPEDYFNPLGLQRAGSIYTISRASFANQLAQLTSLQLPDAESLAGKVAAIPTAQAAVKALIGAAEQIRSWIYKASEVIAGLDSDDDVEWSAAGGREGLEEVEDATTRFEKLINVYVTAIEDLQGRMDIAHVSTDDLTRAVMQMEAITEEWTNIRSTLRNVRGQVEIAMEWEELWNVVLGEIQTELDELSRLVFEMEERRHKSAMAISSGDAVDIGDLATIAEETPPAATRAKAAANKRFSSTGSPSSPTSPGGPTVTQDDSGLLALFARMQPLRASLDFLPMRLSVFEARAQKSFPSACDELEMRREDLDASYRKLEKDAEGLRKELGEDRWVLVFRGAARQAQKMMESVDRSVARLREAVDARMHLTNQPALLKKIESFDAKKTHYGPAIDRVLFIIDRGVKDRLTVNGEILRLHAEMQAKWADLKNQIKEMDLTLDELHADKRGNNLRDSISSMLSNDFASTVGSGVETPQSSPPSSVIMSGLGIDTRTPGKPGTATRARRSSSSVSGHLQPGRRSVSATATPSIPRKPVSRLSTVSGLSTPKREGSATPTTNRHAASIPRPASTMAQRPKWNANPHPNHVDTGHNFKPLTLSTPSPYAKTTPNPVRSHSSLAAPIGSKLPMMRSPLRADPSSPSQDLTPSKPPANKMSFRDRLAAPGPYSQQTTSKFRPEGPSTRRATLQPPQAPVPGLYQRPASSLATTHRRGSLLPQPRFRKEESAPGRESPMPSSFGTRLGLRRGNSTASNDKDKDKDNKPRWRH
ncbi:hypothetical protein KVR01_004895 [Diaporthe batatas]|uniref:uncharacterized protein n=1 Tax=Diaporthe batatas TaxID=748121 RepID=UPI001D058B3B|nr:uncharacterized protein KVR01_004895 [Diaporthe batatas]KAG8164620.1 hypothetical protein KVR01_004895 [Diaporthe batatas]